MYLVDTNVLSIRAPGRKQRPATLVAWMDEHSNALFLSAVTVAEVCNGISRMERNGATTRAAQLTDWLDIVVLLYGDRVIPFDVAAARHAGTLMDRAHATGQSPGFADLAIAATAASRGLTVLTRNVRHFVPLDVRAINPFESLPGQLA